MATQPSFVSQPSIVRIPVLLRELLDGELLIPRFQRPMIWTIEKQLLLLDSIRRNYPIGSMLVWRTRSHALATFEQIGGLAVMRHERSMPEYKQYVLDGHQRLGTLLRMLGPGLITSESSLEDEVSVFESDDSDMIGNVYFDLVSESFVRIRRKGERRMTWLPVSILLDPYRLDPFKVELAKLLGKEGRRLGQIADNLAVRFKDYTLPVTPLASEDLEFVTESFRRVNSAGIPMSEVHMVHALSWTKELDLVSQFEEMQSRFTERGWEGISSESLLTTCKVIIGLDPARAFPDELKEYIRENPQVLSQVERCLEAATEFLSNLNVRGLRVLPYEYQLVGLAFIANRHGGRLPIALRPALEKWFWYITYSAYLNNLVSLRKVIEWLQGASLDEAVPVPVDADPRVVPIRRIHFHNGRTRAFALLLARSEPLDPRGSRQNLGEVLALHGGDALVSLLPKRLARGRENAPENRMLLEPKYAEAMRRLCLDSVMFDFSEESEKPSFLSLAKRPELRRQVLASHLISVAAERALDERRFEDFLDLRRAEIDRVEGQFVESVGLRFGELN